MKMRMKLHAVLAVLSLISTLVESELASRNILNIVGEPNSNIVRYPPQTDTQRHPVIAGDLHGYPDKGNYPAGGHDQNKYPGQRPGQGGDRDRYPGQGGNGDRYPGQRPGQGGDRDRYPGQGGNGDRYPGHRPGQGGDRDRYPGQGGNGDRYPGHRPGQGGDRDRHPGQGGNGDRYPSQEGDRDRYPGQGGHHETYPKPGHDDREPTVDYVTFYEKPYFRGWDFTVRLGRRCRNLEDEYGRYNNEISSVKTYGNCMVVFTRFDCRGREFIIRPRYEARDRYRPIGHAELAVDLNNRISSYRRC